MTVDVVIPTYRPDEKYDRLLRMLEKQTVAPGCVIVINTEEALYGEHPTTLSNLKLCHISKTEFDHGGTRNKGIGMSQADLVLFLTQDAVPKDEYLIQHLMACFSDPGVAAAYGRQLPAPGCNLIERYTRQFNYPSVSFVKTRKDLERLGIKTYFCSDVCAMYRREVYERLGGFPLKTIFNEDMIFASSVIGGGFGIAYCAEAAVIHSHNYTGAKQFRRNFDLAVSQSQYPQVFGDLRSEGEGIRLVKSTAAWLCKNGHIFLLPQLVFVSGCKYLGYRLGRKYQKLPKKLVRFCSMNKDYWSEN